MPFVLDTATFPTLSAEALQSVAEAPRAERLLALAGALSVPPDTALAVLASASGLPVLAEPVIDPDSLRLLPARLVHEYQLVPVKDPADSPPPPAAESADSPLPAPSSPLHLATPWPPTIEIIDWLATFTARPLVWRLSSADRVKDLIVANYGVGGGSL
jgi:general secretion pathway protein E